MTPETQLKETEINYASLEWGIKESFRSYFERLPDHSYNFTAGARRCSDGQIEFTADDRPGNDADTLAFKGSVHLTGHHGALSVRITSPHVSFRPDGTADLSAEVDEVDGQPVRMVIANLTRENPGEVRQPNLTFRAELAEEGQYLFMGNYYAGDALDPVSIWFVAS
ncbi:HtaA domain-containing protein [Corynebacterium sp. YIM 101645]|uniref:HtaA domain-containing protein n=1 Tax=Corynebacterium lemuris TaxID=1859292 RepID=A0ABT2FTK3_9CORY|nr:HtaA domain-containing protein [Corynebacterium lemuris]MCS5478145.1 HtaA domain-containing protein [Corynebacterium lemuris]